MRNCSIYSIWPAHRNLLNLHQMRNQHYCTVSTFPCDLAPHCISSFTGAKTLLKSPPLILGHLCLWWGCLAWWLIYGLENWGIMLEFSARAKQPFLLQSKPIGFAAQPASYSMAKKRSFPGGKVARMWSWPPISYPSSLKIKNEWSYTAMAFTCLLW